MRRAALMACLFLGACSLDQFSFMQGGERCDPLWDRMDYRKRQNEPERNTVLTRSSEEQPDSDFGACSEDDLVNYSVGGDTNSGHTSHR